MEDYEFLEKVRQGIGARARQTAGIAGLVLGGWGVTHPEAVGELQALSYWLIPAAGCLLYDGVKESWELVDEIWTGVKEELKNEAPYKRKDE